MSGQKIRQLREEIHQLSRERPSLILLASALPVLVLLIILPLARLPFLLVRLIMLLLCLELLTGIFAFWEAWLRRDREHKAANNRKKPQRVNDKPSERLGVSPYETVETDFPFPRKVKRKRGNNPGKRS